MMRVKAAEENLLQFTKEPYIEDVGPRRIKSIKFSTFSEADILKSAEVQIYLDRYYDQNRKPVLGGLLDPHLGTSKDGLCATCAGNFEKCPGHFGYFALALPVYNYGYLDTIILILKCICKSCASILLPEKEHTDFLKKMRKDIDPLKKCELVRQIVKRCTSIASSTKAGRCSKCGYINGVVKGAPSGMYGIIHDRSKVADNSYEECQSAISQKDGNMGFGLSKLLNPVIVLSLFKKMQDKDCGLLYLSDRPEKFMITKIIVPPNPVRPSVFVSGGQMSNEDDISERLKQIIQVNATLHHKLTRSYSSTEISEFWYLLQVEVARFINKDVRGLLPNMHEKPLNGFVQRLKGKHGRFRGNLSGKRVEYTGRTVISPDPNLKITEVAIPIQMAHILTYPERVSSHNIEKLRQCVRNGYFKYPGANILRNTDGKLMHKYCQQS